MSTVVWGLSSSIAIYKAVEAIRLLTKDGAVRVVAVLSARAEDFIRPLLIEALTHAPVYRAHEVMTPDHQILHTALAREADLIVLAPATAHLMARIAHGMADDLLTSTVLAYDGRVVVAPAMNVHMWRNPATQQNVRLLEGRGFVIVGPVEGPQAEGDVGMGRLVEPAELVEVVRTYLDQRRALEGQTVLVTAGPTQEPLDAVRFISNPSSGKMGFAIAEAALQRGAHVILVAGPVQLMPHPAIEFYSVRTAQEMADVVFAHADRADWVVKAAAVADYRPSEVLPYKRKKAGGPWTVRLEPTVDILAALGRRKRPGQILIGFAAETEDAEEHALQKLDQKNLDFIVLNVVDQPGRGFQADTNQVVLWSRDRRRWESPLASKLWIAHWLWDRWLEVVEMKRR